MKNNLKNRKFYEFFFIILLEIMIIYWIVSIFSQGASSIQNKIFFANMRDFWADRTNVIGYSSQLDPYNNKMYSGLGEKAYPPFVYVIMYLFSRLVNMQPYYDSNRFLHMYTEPLFLFMIILFICLIMIIGYGLIVKCKKGSVITKMGTAFALLLSGPMLFTLERGNIIIWVPFLCLGFILFHNDNNWIIKEIGLLCLAIASAIKITPAILGFLLLIEHNWKSAIRTAIYGIIFFFGPFLVLKGGLDNILLMIRNLGYLMNTYKNADGCTIRNIFRTAETVFSLSHTPDSVITITSIVVSILLIFCSFFSTKKWETVMALMLLIIAVPNYSGYYCLIYLIPPTILFLNEDNHPLFDLVVLLALLLIYNPVYSIVNQYGIDYHLGIAGLLLYMIVQGVKYISKMFLRNKASQFRNRIEIGRNNLQCL